MEEKRVFWVVGGDQRQRHLAAALAGDGHRVGTYALGLPEDSPGGMEKAGCVVLPLPACREGKLNAPLAPGAVPLERVLDVLAPGQLVCAGMPDERLFSLAGERDIRVEDYYAREELAVANAVPAALAVWQR